MPDVHERPRKKVALLIESSRGYGRGLLEGVSRYMREHGTWSVFFQERRRGDPPPDWLRGWKGDGVIARIEDRRLIRAILKLGLPAIDLRGLIPLKIPLIETDDRAVVACAVEHLCERGFRHFGFCGFPGANYSDKRCSYFVEMLARRGLRCHVHQPRLRTRPSPEFGFEQFGLPREQGIARWLTLLPRPIAILACNDVCGQQVLNACRAIGTAVPDEVAVVGVDNDHLLCELSDPPLSSVAPDTLRIGYMAAELLSGLMAGRRAPTGTIFVPPLGVVARRSSDVLAMDDRDIAAALRFMRERVCEGINVSDVLKHTAMSRSLFERRFKKALGRTPKTEILRLRVQRVKDLLAGSELSPRQIAQKTGFQNQEYMFAVFKRLTGATPQQFRKQSRL
ncbi:MAG TPA: DNA-binding transcriptional regulator [Planctomycetota bacterium]|nr:DNA-binding transcriptional regulator [Planctomycetota bacterium]